MFGSVKKEITSCHQAEGSDARGAGSYYSDVIMSSMASQITSASIVCLTVCSGPDQRKLQSSASLAFVRNVRKYLGSVKKEITCCHQAEGSDARGAGSYYSDVIMSSMASQITSASIVCLTVCSGPDQRKHQSSASLAFVRNIRKYLGSVKKEITCCHQAEGSDARGAGSYYSDVIMSSMASQITSVSIVCLTVCSGPDQWKHQSSASLAFVRGIHRWPVTRIMFPFDDVIMLLLMPASDFPPSELLQCHWLP